MIRIATAVLLLALFFPALLWAPAPLWAGLAGLVLLLGAREWGRLADFPRPVSWLYAALLATLALAIYLAGAAALGHALLAVAAAFWILLAPWWLYRGWPRGAGWVRALVGAVVLLPTWIALIDLRVHGPGVLLAIMAAVWIADSAAYYSGRAFGRRRLAPHVSPGKTWEGVAGAALALVLYSAALSHYAVHVSMAALALLLLALMYFAILGDLFESWMKRQAGLKDSGHMLPGHGGVLDRVDALTAALPLAALVVWGLKLA